jgi:protein arginine kinase
MLKWYGKSGPESDVVISTRIRLARNLREFSFPVKMNKSDRHKLVERVVETATGSNSVIENHFHFVNMEDISKIECVSLVERHLASPEFISKCEGRGMLVTEDESVSVLLNAENHLSLQTTLEGLNLQEAYQIADHIDTILDKSLHFAFDPILGYLTQNPADLGTGMRASLMLHLPALKDGGGIARISSSLNNLGLALNGIYGSGTEPKGAIYQLSNQVTLGLSEQAAITNLNCIAMQIIAEERSARQELAQNLDAQDIVSRSMGILQSARLMTNDEFMHLISNIRFGIAVGLIENISYDQIDRLIIEAQPATLMIFSGKKLTPNDRHILRAQIIHDVFKNKIDKADDNYGGTNTQQ